MNSDLVLSVKKMIIDALNLEDITPEDIDTDAPLFGDGLGLDSIDALELGLALKNTFGVSISPESENVREHFYSVATLVRFIESQKK
ncbi:MAG: acyl carrier protein [Ruminobacter sp.]|jgi:acyl carrier protein|uniref:Acyl carrier protein n=1 Tax=Ruminobacter amylophilus TaxID=867 RepID=A0A662ZEI7_9GAMM|nr:MULTISPECIES: phosphopantetheine-binding protein [Ruminobacter]MBQ3774891.1 acyl carrier protein [Ruminobacter sp.]SFP04689.1 acyl carrier protein [Ruminobacter amylophilus]